jgi:hypothetical protein
MASFPWIFYNISDATFAVFESVFIKKPFLGDNCKEQLNIKRWIYKRLRPHSYITKFFCAYKNMIVLERLKYLLRKRLYNLHKHNQLPIG